MGLLIRLPGLNDPIYATEYDLTNELYFSNLTEDYNGHNIYVHPPFATSLYYLFSHLIPDSAIGYRIVPLLFWVFSTFLIFIISRDFFGYRSALFSSLIMSFIYPMVNYSLRIDYIMMQISFLILISLFLLKYFSSKKDKYLFFTGISVGISFWINYSSLFFVVVISLFVLYKKRDFRNAMITLFKIGIPAMLIFLLFPLLSFIFEPNIFLRTLSMGNKFSGIPNIMPFIYLLVFVGPLLTGMFLKSIFSKERPKYYAFLIMWFSFILISIIFTKRYAMVDRYVILTVPPLCLIGGWILSSFKFNKRDLITFSTAFILWFLVIFTLNLYASPVPVGINQYIKQILDLNLNFILPFTGRTGPMFGLSFISVISSITISIIFLISSLVLKKKSKISNTLFILFLSTALSFNLLIIQEYLIPISNPNYPQITHNLIEHAKEIDLPKPIYGNNYALVHYFDLGYKEYVSLYGEYANVPFGTDVDYIKSRLLEDGGTAIVVDFPYLDRSGDVWNLINEKCVFVKKAYSNGKNAGSLFLCSKT